MMLPPNEQAAIDALDEETRTNVAQALWLDSFDIAELAPEIIARLADPSNAPSAHGDRMRRFIGYLLEHPVSRTPSYRKIYRELLKHCDELSPHQAYVIQTGFLGPASTVGYDMMPARADLQFPRDHLPKTRSQVGWHFFVGSCWSEDGTEYGVELMFFETALYPPAIAAGFGLSDDENQVVELQFAISEKGGKHLQAEPVVIAGTSGLVSYDTDPFVYRLGRNTIQCHREGEFFPVTIRAWGVDRGTEPSRTLSIDLTFSSGKEVLLQGENGSMPSVDGTGSLYYSIPNMVLDPAESSLTIDGKHVELARGSFWFDHQWGFLTGAPRTPVMRAANNVKKAPPTGWDWFMAQFDGDRQLTVFSPHTAEFASFYQQTGAAPPGVMKVPVAGTLMRPDKSTYLIRGTLEITDWIKADHSPNPARYLITDTWYPNGWTFRLDDEVPEDIRTFTMTAIVSEAQSGFFANGAQYAEGAVILKDVAGKEVGRGFAESVSYADTRRTTHRLAGLPEAPAFREAMRPPEPSPLLRLANTVYVMRHKKELEKIISESAALEFFTR